MTGSDDSDTAQRTWAPEGSWILVAGGAGFLGSNFTRLLLDEGCNVVCVDDVSTGRWENLADLGPMYGDRLLEIEHDIRLPLGPVAERLGTTAITAVCNLASPASPPAYLARPIDTLEIGSVGTQNLLDFAVSHGSRFLQASTSEIYGDPLEHPQSESYWGNVNPTGPRSVYDEAKRFGEALCFAYERARGLDLRLMRIFNTYGPRMQVDDGRVVTNFINQALSGEPLTIYGSGDQTRSFCYVDDLVRGFWALLRSDYRGPVNLGNPNEFTMGELASLVLQLTGSTSEIRYTELPEDDPKQRQPNIGIAKSVLGWQPTVELRAGLARTIDWFTSQRTSGSF
jgi:dTDP-glucose 4,6-dehydratase